MKELTEIRESNGCRFGDTGRISMDELVSIIVPVYNVECYLQECLDSILCQEFQNYEIKARLKCNANMVLDWHIRSK